MMRRVTREIFVGDVGIGGNHPISIQSMTNTKTADAQATLRQINALSLEGCEIVRVGITYDRDIEGLRCITKSSPIPVIADIQYNYRHAIEAIEAGAQGIRINPGYLESEDEVRAVAECCRRHGVSIRVGVNSGSVNPRIKAQFGGINAMSLAHSALAQVKILEAFDFYDIKVAIKASDPMMMIEANRIFSGMGDYPLHLGVTESGTNIGGIVKSAVGIGCLLAEGIGDTIRVSLTEDPVEEVRIAKQILEALGLRRFGINLVSCPTCSRTEIDLIALVKEAERRLKGVNKPLTVAIMGCPVNGPGEAREADIGISGGRGEGVIFRKGELVRRVKEEELLDALIDELNHM